MDRNRAVAAPSLLRAMARKTNIFNYAGLQLYFAMLHTATCIHGKLKTLSLSTWYFKPNNNKGSMSTCSSMIISGGYDKVAPLLYLDLGACSCQPMVAHMSRLFGL